MIELKSFPADFGEVAYWLALSLDPANDSGAGSMSLAELCRGALCFRVEADGKVVGAYAVEISRHEAGAVAWINAAGGRLPGVDFTAALLPAIESQLAQHGVRCMAIPTRRLGLVKKLARQGYFSSAVVMRKFMGTLQ